MAPSPTCPGCGFGAAFLESFVCEGTGAYCDEPRFPHRAWHCKRCDRQWVTAAAGPAVKAAA